MKKAIVCVKDNKRIGYWSRREWKILTKTIETYDNDDELAEVFQQCCDHIPYTYDDVVPIIMIISFETPAEMIAESCNKYLANAKWQWPHKPEMIAAVERAISKIPK
jgi:hypothetical protein